MQSTNFVRTIKHAVQTEATRNRLLKENTSKIKKATTSFARENHFKVQQSKTEIKKNGS